MKSQHRCRIFPPSQLESVQGCAVSESVPWATLIDFPQIEQQIKNSETPISGSLRQFKYVFFKCKSNYQNLNELSFLSRKCANAQNSKIRKNAKVYNWRQESYRWTGGRGQLWSFMATKYQICWFHSQSSRGVHMFGNFSAKIIIINLNTSCKPDWFAGVTNNNDSPNNFYVTDRPVFVIWN